MIDLDDLLLLALALTLGLAARSSDKVFLFLLGDSLGICPFLVLLAALVWLAGLRDTSAKSELLLSLLSEVISVGDAVVFGLGLGNFSSWGGLSVTSQSLLLISLSDSLTSYFISEFGASFGGTPSVSCLLLRFTSNTSAVSIKVATTTTASSPTSTTLVGTLSTGWSVLLNAIFNRLGAVVRAASIAVTESSFVAAESTTTTSSSYRCCRSLRSRSVSGSIALNCPGGSLINDLHRWLWLLVRVFIVIIAEKLVKILRGDCRHLVHLSSASEEGLATE
jgi:hypothetical protein